MKGSIHLRSSAAALIALFALLAPKPAQGAVRLHFVGAAREVGGSACLVESDRAKVLVDFGLRFGGDESRNASAPFDPASLSCVVLTHAHTDHVGRVPLLVRKGFRGSVLATEQTKAIAEVMLEMSYDIGRSEGKALFDKKDLVAAMAAMRALPYDVRTPVAEGVELRLRDAGHILGSSIVELWVKDAGGECKVVFSGDLGQRDSPLLKDPATIERTDYVVVESTYGTTRRRHAGFDRFGQALGETLAKGGSVLIPSYTLEKSQKVLYVLGELKRDGVLPGTVPVFLDSSSAQKLTGIYRKYPEMYDLDAGKVLREKGDPLSFPGLREVPAKESLGHHATGQPAIYVSSSGNLDHATAPRHLEAMIEDERDLLAIVGWQSYGSLGRKLQDGAREVDIRVEDYAGGRRTTRVARKPVRMKVERFDTFSSHADGCELLEWVSKMDGVRGVFVTHGEEKSALAVADAIESRLGFEASAPREGEAYTLSLSEPARTPKRSLDICDGMAFGEVPEED